MTHTGFISGKQNAARTVSYKARLLSWIAVLAITLTSAYGQDEETTDAASTNDVAEAIAPATTGDVKTNAPAADSVADSNSDKEQAEDADSFAILTQRNIFDPNRRAPRKSTERAPEPVRQPRVDTFALTGVMSYAKGTFAFFDGSSSMYREAVQAGDKFAGYTIQDITPDLVKLQKDDKSVELKVGEQMQREDAGEWKITSNATFTRPSGSKTTTTTTSDSASTADSHADEPSDALQRLLQKRKKEMNK